MEILRGLPLSENEVELISKVLNSESAPLEALVATVAAIMIDLAKKEVQKEFELFKTFFLAKNSATCGCFGFFNNRTRKRAIQRRAKTAVSNENARFAAKNFQRKVKFESYRI